MSDIKVLTSSEEASKYEASPDYVTVDIVVEDKQKYGIFRLKEKPKEEVKEVKKNDKK